MPIVEKRMEAFEATYICDDCGKGVMVWAGFAFTTNPLQYPHDCSNPECKVRKNFPVHYPTIIHRKVSPEVLYREV